MVSIKFSLRLPASVILHHDSKPTYHPIHFLCWCLQQRASALYPTPRRLRNMAPRYERSPDTYHDTARFRREHIGDQSGTRVAVQPCGKDLGIHFEASSTGIKNVYIFLKKKISLILKNCTVKILHSKTILTTTGKRVSRLFSHLLRSLK